MRTFTFRISFVLLFLGGVITSMAQSSFSGGTGTQADPYLISSTDDLIKLSADVNGGLPYSGCFLVHPTNA